MRKANQKDTSGNSKILLIHSSVGALIGMMMTILILLGISILLVTKALPDSMIDSYIIVAVLIGTTISGLYCAGKQGTGVITAGIVAAAAYIILLLIATMMFRRSGGESVLTIKEIIASVAGGCFGGVLRLHKKRKKSRLRK